MSRYRVRSFFNNYLGGATVNADQPADREARAREHSPFFDGYRAGDELIESEIVVAADASSPQAAADEAFRQLNEDSRPNGKRERSLSVGDLCAVYEQDAETPVAVFACENVGWRSLEADELPTTLLS